jgi:hypothetical protein
MSEILPQTGSPPPDSILSAAAKRLWESVLPFAVVIALWQFASLFFRGFGARAGR